jgi:excinuclease ABC subunit C
MKIRKMPQHRNIIMSKLRKIPQKPGVYSFYDRKKKLLYVGKAINLRSRVKSYFAGDRNIYNASRVQMLREIADLKWEEAGSEPEALIREAELIKKMKPHYNIVLRDDKNYFFVGFTKEAFPKVYLTHQPVQHETRSIKHETSKSVRSAPSSKLHASSFIGPFTDGASLKRTLGILRRIFPYCTCRTPHKRQCLAATIGRCVDACCHKDAAKKFPQYADIKKRYRQSIKSLIETLSGKRHKLSRTLSAEMKKASADCEYEKAALLRDQLRALKEVFSHKAIVGRRELDDERLQAVGQLLKLLGGEVRPSASRLEMYDMSNIQGEFAVGSMVVFSGGGADKSQYRRFRIRTVKGANDVAMMREVLMRRLKHAEWPLPDVLAVDGGIAQIGAAIKALKITGVAPMPVIGLAKGKEELHMALLNETGKNLDVSYHAKYTIKTMRQSELGRPIRHLLEYMQSEAHRFAITYYRKLHQNI